MRLLGETNCLVFDNFTQAEATDYFNKFGEKWWNDTDDIICIPIKKLVEEEIEGYTKFFGKDVSKCDFVIILI